jgi:hypothetical protein
VPEDGQALLECLVSSRLTPGEPIEVAEAAPYRGVIKLFCDENEVMVGCAVGERIWSVARKRTEIEHTPQGSHRALLGAKVHHQRPPLLLGQQK